MYNSLLQLTRRPHLARSLPLFQGLRQLVAIDICIQRAQCATSNPHNRSTKREQSNPLVRIQQSKDGIRVVPILLEANLLRDVSIHSSESRGRNVQSTTNMQTQTPCSFPASTAVPGDSSGCSAMADSVGLRLKPAPLRARSGNTDLHQEAGAACLVGQPVRCRWHVGPSTGC